MDQKQEFLGGLIGGILVKKGVEFAVERGMKALAKDRTVSLEPKDVKEATAVVTQSVQKEVEAQVQHRTDTEPHYSSRNMWGSLVGIITAIETIRIFWTDGQPQSVQEWLVPVGIIVAALTPLYSRFIAKKPLAFFSRSGG
jgi:hypothetical protein